jgi:hypothetical protein
MRERATAVAVPAAAVVPREAWRANERCSERALAANAKRRWCVTGGASALAAVAPLIEARTAIGAVGVIGAGAPLPDDAGAVLRLGGPPPQSPFITRGDGGRAVVGWLPEAESPSLERFARAAARVVQRLTWASIPRPLALLAQWDDRALALADALEPLLGASALRWTAERVARRDLVEGLGCGVAAAVYVGHALRWGWVGYGGVTAGELAAAVLEPLGCVLSIACDTALADDAVPSFAAALPLAGACAATLGASGKTLHESNRALAHAVCAALPAAPSLADVLLAVPESALAGYVVRGDPAAPIASSLGARERAGALYAPAPDAPLSLAPGWPIARSVLDGAAAR